MNDGPKQTSAVQVDPTHLYVAHWHEVDAVIRQADLKAQVLLGIDALLLAGLSRTSEAALGGIAPVDTFLEFLTLGLLIASITMALVTIAPRQGQVANEEALLYFQAVATMDAKAFVGKYLAMTPEQLLANVANEIHAKSRVAARKLSRIRIGVLLLAAAALSWSTALMVGI